MKKQFILLKEIIPREIVIGDKKREIEVEKVSQGKIKISYKAVKGPGPKPFTFPEKIVLNKSLGEAIGLYLGDGKTTKLETDHAEFVSKDKELNLFALDFFRFLGCVTRGIPSESKVASSSIYNLFFIF